MKISTLLKAAMLASVFASSTSYAELVTTTFDNGSSLSDWTTDRSTPAGFEIVNNELVMSIDGSEARDLDNFRSTQGMKLDTNGATFVSIDMFVDASWTGAKRFGGFWGVATNADGDISAYPILEFQGAGTNFTDTGIAFWDNNGWVDVSTLFNNDAFNTFAFQIASNGIEYFLNGTLIHTDSESGSISFSDIILNAKNVGDSYSVRFDNLVVGTSEVPMPASIGLLALGILALCLRKRLC
jgi:hypothetical protein